MPPEPTKRPCEFQRAESALLINAAIRAAKLAPRHATYEEIAHKWLPKVKLW